jgi:hypothetical protein
MEETVHGPAGIKEGLDGDAVDIIRVRYDFDHRFRREILNISVVLGR